MIKRIYRRLRTRTIPNFANLFSRIISILVSPLITGLLVCSWILLSVTLLPVVYLVCLLQKKPPRQYEDSQLEAVECNYCGSGARKTVYDFSPLLIVKCKKCGLVYTSPRLNLSTIEERLYGSDFFSAYEDVIETDVAWAGAFHQRWLESLAVHTNKKQWKICEIGPGLGSFLAEAKKRGHDVYGIELSEHAINYARTHFGIDTIHHGAVDCIDSLDLPQMDVIVMFASIEHLQDPLGTLQKVNRCLSEDGLLLLGTGVWGCFSQVVAREAWPIIAPDGHLYYFSKRTMRMFLEKAGFLPLSLETNTALMNIATKNKFLVWLFNNRVTARLGIPEFVEKRRLGDEMWIISKKVAAAY
jgi:2-polyprenyl-3-methyl-5-hydroxy-6-metoxy-1,4-benzoquinol methylase